MYYYFTASTKKLDQDSLKYKEILSALDNAGGVGINYVHFPKKHPDRQKIELDINSGKVSPYSIQTSLVDQADFLVADLGRETVTVGYQIEYAIRKKIPVLVLMPEIRKKQVPVMLTDNHTGLLFLRFYSGILDLKKIIEEFISNLQSGRIKFNFFISVSMSNYLGRRSKKEHKAKSILIRELLEKEMRNNPL